MDKVQDMMAGSYFIEELSITFIDKAWGEFQNIERMGGLIKGLESGAIKEKIQLQHSERVVRINKEESTMIGVNKFMSLDDEKTNIIEHPIKDDHPWIITPITLSTNL